MMIIPPVGSRVARMHGRALLGVRRVHFVPGVVGVGVVGRGRGVRVVVEGGGVGGWLIGAVRTVAAHRVDETAADVVLHFTCDKKREDVLVSLLRTQLLCKFHMN